MDISGVVLRAIPCVLGSVGTGTGARQTNRKVIGGFRDEGHLMFYCKSGCGTNKKKDKVKVKVKEVDSSKRKLKLLKGLTRDLSTFSAMTFSTDGLVGDFQVNTFSEASDVLLKQLQQLRAEEKELKQRRKQEKAMLKAERMAIIMSDSSSSESSDSDSDKDTPNEAAVESQIPVEVSVLQTQSEVKLMEETFAVHTSNIISLNKGAKRVEVCMGGKCKKSWGAAALLEEFGRVIGDQGDVVGCKCMGKCKDGPNVKVFSDNNTEDSVTSPLNPLYIGVALEDVSVIAADLFGLEKKPFGLNSC